MILGCARIKSNGSAHYGRTIYAVETEGDLRCVFYLDGETVVSLIVGTHGIYKD